jgi:hypothetical protein
MHRFPGLFAAGPEPVVEALAVENMLANRNLLHHGVFNKFFKAYYALSLFKLIHFLSELFFLNKEY